jgi:hypothetical protein
MSIVGTVALLCSRAMSSNRKAVASFASGLMTRRVARVTEIPLLSAQL